MGTVNTTQRRCQDTGKICYTEREAGIVINGCKKHIYAGNRHWAKAQYGNSKDIPRRKYFCKDCGYFHVSHFSMYNTPNNSREEAFYLEYEENQKRKGA